MSGTQRLPGGVRRKASQRRSRPATPLQPLIGRLCILGTGCAGGTASVFSVAMLVTVNTPRL
jgi:hypothetical protein